MIMSIYDFITNYHKNSTSKITVFENTKKMLKIIDNKQYFALYNDKQRVNFDLLKQNNHLMMQVEVRDKINNTNVEVNTIVLITKRMNKGNTLIININGLLSKEVHGKKLSPEKMDILNDVVLSNLYKNFDKPLKIKYVMDTNPSLNGKEYIISLFQFDDKNMTICNKNNNYECIIRFFRPETPISQKQNGGMCMIENKGGVNKCNAMTQKGTHCVFNAISNGKCKRHM